MKKIRFVAFYFNQCRNKISLGYLQYLAVQEDSVLQCKGQVNNIRPISIKNVFLTYLSQERQHLFEAGGVHRLKKRRS